MRFAFRSLVRAPGVSLVAILTLALGIGINTALFSGIHAYLWSPFPYPDAHQLVALSQTNPSQGLLKTSVSWLDVEDWRGAKTLAGVAAYRFEAATLTGAGEPARVAAVVTTPELFALLGAGPAQGRTFGPAERRVAVLSHGLWQRQFGGERGLIGRPLRLDGKNWIVAGILPREFTFLYQDADVFLPLELQQDATRNRASRSLAAIARLRPGASVAQAQAEIQTISARLEREAPATNLGWAGQVTTIEDELIPRRARLGALTLLLAVGFVLLIACANVANLLLARGTLRRTELAVRSALGASRGALVRLLLGESMLLALAGAALALLFAWWAIALLKGLAPAETAPRTGPFSLNATALLYATALAVCAGLLAGAAPAWLLSRGELSAALREGGRGGAGGRHGALGMLVVLEVAAAVVLLAASGLLVRSLAFLVNASPGFDPKNLLVSHVWLPPARYSAPQAAAFFDEALAGLRRNAQVRSAAAASSLPLGAAESYATIAVEGRATVDPLERNFVGTTAVTPGYFRTLGIALVAGRDFTAGDGPGAPAAAVINETMARRYWRDPANALGRRFVEGNRRIAVIGVVKDVRREAADRPARPEMFLPHAQSPALSMLLVVRAAVAPGRLAPALRAAVRAVDGELPLGQIESLDDLRARRILSSRLMAQLLGALAGLALALAALGIYGLMAYAASRRMREVGVRIALGARPGDIFSMLIGNGLRLAAAGLAIGLACAWAVTPLLRSLLAGVRPHDAAAFLAVAAVLLAVVLVACSVPARRATRVDPAAILRAE